MVKGEINLEARVKEITKKFLEISKGKQIHVVSHFDTDGITSAAIIVKALKRLDLPFTLKICKSLTKEFIERLPKDKLILFLDLASGSLHHLGKSGIKNIFILDHHEINSEIPENVEILNPELDQKQKISGSGLSYLFAKEIDSSNKDSAKLAILGMIGDQMHTDISKLNNGILEDGGIIKKKGVLIYPSTRPINRTLELSSDPFIPGVTGDSEGVRELLGQSGIKPENGRYKNLVDLTESEMKRLTTNIILRNPKIKNTIIAEKTMAIKFVKNKISAPSAIFISKVDIPYPITPIAGINVVAVSIPASEELIPGQIITKAPANPANNAIIKSNN